jgi:predicted nucleic acid-binding protein
LSRFLLDTNIISDATKPTPSEKLAEWFSAQEDDALCISSLTLAELWRGILLLPQSQKRSRLETWFAGPTGPTQLFHGRVLSFDDRAALIWARLMVDGKDQGLSLNGTDMMIAAIAEANGCLVVTANERDFRTVSFFNPIAG